KQNCHWGLGSVRVCWIPLNQNRRQPLAYLAWWMEVELMPGPRECPGVSDPPAELGSENLLAFMLRYREMISNNASLLTVYWRTCCSCLLSSSQDWNSRLPRVFSAEVAIEKTFKKQVWSSILSVD
ncbi:heparan-alpha-glucosaminideN-acetyltransferase-like protein, partial [Cricetulus griseus]